MSGAENAVARVVDAIRARGSDTTDLRDGAHEACHAIELQLKKWDRESIHRAIMRRRPGDRIVMECTARAVEQVVCARLGVATDSVEKWAFVTAMESITNRVDVPLDVLITGIRRRMGGADVARLADAVIALTAKPVRRATAKGGA